MKTPIKKTHERQLIKLAQCGEIDALSELVNIHKGFVCLYVKRLRYGSEYYRRIDEEDAYQSCMMGLVEAIYKFDLSKDVVLLTYAPFRMRRRLQKEIETGSIIRMPTCSYSRLKTRHPTTYTKYLPHFQTYDTRPGQMDGSNLDSGYTECIAECNDEIDKAKYCLSKLNYRERTILIERMRGVGQKELGIQFGISKERIRQLENQAKHKFVKIFNSKSPLYR